MHAGLCHRLPAEVKAPATARRLLHDWLTAWNWQAEEAVDVVLAADEAVSNAVQHAAATHVTVEAVIDPVPDPAAASLAGFVAIASPSTAATQAATMAGGGDSRARRVRIEVSDNGR
jgi:two-component sensor histidine kinase